MLPKMDKSHMNYLSCNNLEYIHIEFHSIFGLTLDSCSYHIHSFCHQKMYCLDTFGIHLQLCHIGHYKRMKYRSIFHLLHIVLLLVYMMQSLNPNSNFVDIVYSVNTKHHSKKFQMDIFHMFSIE